MKTLEFAQVAQHNSQESCWVILYGHVYDVTEFLPSHPGGLNAILKLAGQDATEAYDPVHPPGTLEENLKPSARLGRVNPDTLPRPATVDGVDQPVDTEEVNIQNLLNLDEIEALAKKKLSKKAWAYYYSAGDDLISKNLNNAVYRQILLRPRIFVDCSTFDMTTTLLGHRVGLPIFVSPAAMARLAHPAGEHGIAKAVSRFSGVQIVSNNASMSPEQIVADSSPGQIFGWQLYVQTERRKSEAMLARIAKLPPFKFIVLTLDAPVPGKREHDERASMISSPKSKSKPSPDIDPDPPGIGIGNLLFTGTAADLTWQNTLPWLTAHTSLPLILKGIQTHEDALLASRHAPPIRAIILSNHGGRALDTASPAVHTLLEIRRHCPEVFAKVEVWVDGGVKRGTDVVKALCLGARAVGVGRGVLFGLGAGGKEGVERVFEILRAETETCCRLLGVKRLSELGPMHINSRAVERDIYHEKESPRLWQKANL